MKGFFLSVPSVSIDRTLTPLIDEMGYAGYEMIHYNMEKFRPSGKHHFTFRSYPDVCSGYDTQILNENTSYFDLVDMLVNTSAGLYDFLLEEIKTEQPDFIIHSHMALWGKLLAKRCKLPAITLFNTYILDAKIMFPYFKELKASRNKTYNGADNAIRVYYNYQKLYSRAGLTEKPGIWDVYANQEDLNISCILEAFQPGKELLKHKHKFIGYPMQPSGDNQEKKHIYLSMGTIFNDDPSFFRLCLNVFSKIPYPCKLVLGSKLKIGDLGKLPDNVTVMAYTDQVIQLQQSLIFISRGGMASVHEAVYTLTPILVIPEIPEQRLTAEKICRLGIGTQITSEELTEEKLYQAILQLLKDRPGYITKLRELRSTMPSQPAPRIAVELLNNYLTEYAKGY